MGRKVRYAVYTGVLGVLLWLMLATALRFGGLELVSGLVIIGAGTALVYRRTSPRPPPRRPPRPVRRP